MGLFSALPYHSGRNLAQPLAPAASDFSNPALATVTQGRVRGGEGNIETKCGGWGLPVLVKVLPG